MHKEIQEDLELFNRLIALFLADEIDRPISDYLSPEEVKQKLNIGLQNAPAAEDSFKKALTQLVLNTPKTSSNLFFNQLFGGRHSKAVLGDLLAVFLNNSMATYKIAGPQILIEKEILQQVCQMVGYKENASGTFPTGGSMSNFMAMIMARDKVSGTIKTHGLKQERLLMAYTSEDAHYSITKNASFSGIGIENIRNILTDKKGRICVEELEQKIVEDIAGGHVPFFVNATAGTTVLCAFDDIEKIAMLCQKYKIWLHVDGAFGGSVIFSDKHKHLVKGIEQSDSFCFNAHKTLGAPLSTSILVVKNKNDLFQSFNYDANYLYQTHNDEYNLGQTSFECGRRNNALKFWTMWKAIGTNGLADIVDHEFQLADYARNYVLNHPDYVLYSFDESLSVCFNYKDFDPKDLCEQLYTKNALMVGFGEFHNNVFIRLVTINGENSEQDIFQFFQILEQFANENKDNIKRRERVIVSD